MDPYNAHELNISKQRDKSLNAAFFVELHVST